MQLTALELAGFKSFAHPTRLEFGPGLTVVIGPNGSGKSNLAEAIRWVLGEQSTKQLRSQASTDVIFAGNPDRPRQRQASVKLIFNNESDRFPLAAPEITIARHVDQSGASEYTLNGDVARLTDLQQSLAEAGIGPKSYTVISQGMVDRYLTATPEARRELFDEATGIRALQIRLQRTRKQLAQAQQHAQELNTIVQELEPRLRVLARQVKKFAERENILQEFTTKQAAYFTASWHTHYAQTQQLAIDLAATDERRRQSQAQRQRVETSLLAGWPEEPDTGPKRPSLRQLLQRCQRLLQAWQAGTPPNHQPILELMADIDRALAAPTKTTLSPRHTIEQQLTQVRTAELASEREFSLTQAALNQAHQTLAALEAAIRRELGATGLQHIQTNPPPADQPVPHQADIEQLRARLAALGEPDPLIQKEYEEVQKRYEHLRAQLADIAATEQEISKLASALETEISRHFDQQFGVIQTSFAHHFAALFGGGQAQLTTIAEGIEITVAPPAKRARHVNSLSGGEKALTSLALLFAIIDAQQPPFLVLDEVDAALDEANSRRFVEALKAKSQTTQCLVISHNREMFAAADVLYGVTMATDGISKVYSVKLENLPEEETQQIQAQ